MAASAVPSQLSDWLSSIDYQLGRSTITVEKFLEVTDLLLENPNLNSTHLFRADILSDDAHILKTNIEKESQCGGRQDETHSAIIDDRQADLPVPAPKISNASLQRTILRRLIPRNRQLDQPLSQTCHIYKSNHGGYIVIYMPHVTTEDDMPWYHPPIKALAYVFEPYSDNDFATLSILYVSFNDTAEPVPNRLHRTIISLLNTFSRLAKSSSPATTALSSTDSTASHHDSILPSALKDTIIPQHIIQDTYSNLKHKYASFLIARWVEKTEPSKHVFEDIMIAAFLIELWKTMFQSTSFPGFVDIACGNGVLVYILISEGYQGYGLDARRRKTWDVLGIEEFLRESIIVPKPFLDALSLTAENALVDIDVHYGIFPPETFIISNHADELTPWTPILAAISSPAAPLPFLAIPCCSHALSGAKRRYTPKDAVPLSALPPTHPINPTTPPATTRGADLTKIKEDQPPTGDLKALRAQKAKAVNHTDDKSMYACLTRKVVAIAKEVGFADDDDDDDDDTHDSGGRGVEMTLMRIPSTRNIGVVGGGGRRMRRIAVGHEVETMKDGFKTIKLSREMVDEGEDGKDIEMRSGRIQALIERECARSGGVKASARMWIERAKTLQTGKGRGKVNLGRKQEQS